MKQNIIISNKPNISWIKPSNIESSINSNNFNIDYLETLNKFKNSGIKTLELREVAQKISDGPFGSQLVVEEYRSEGFPVYRVKNIVDTQVLDDDIVYITDEKQKQLSRSEVLPGDVLITKAGRIGSAATIPTRLGVGNITSHLVLVRLKELCYNYYLVAYLESKYGKIITRRESYKSTRPELTKTETENILIPVPSAEIQKYVGDKIKKAEELREEAKRLKKEAEDLLIDELGIKKLNEKLNIHTEKYSWTEEKNLSDRIDGEFYKTEFLLNNEHTKKLSLQGIVIKKLKDIILSGSYGILPSSSDYGKGEVELLRSTNIKEFLIDHSDVIKVPEIYYKDKVKINNGDILLEIKGQCYAGAIAENIKNRTIINGSVFKFSLKEGFNNYYVLAYLLSQSGQLQKKQNLANSIISYLSIDCINDLQIPILNKEKQDVIGDKYRMYVQKYGESKQLIQEAKQDVEDLIEGNFNMSKIKETN